MIEVYTMYLGRLAAALMTPNTTFQLECSACGRDWRTCPTNNVLSTDHIHVPCTLLFAHVAHSRREDIHVHVQSEGEEAGGVVADHSRTPARAPLQYKLKLMRMPLLSVGKSQDTIM